MTNLIKLALIFAFIFSASCSKKKPAQIIDRGKMTFTKNATQNKEKYQQTVRVKKPVFEKSNKSQTITVAVGETLYSLARKYQISVRDLIAQNNLTPPYVIKPGDQIAIPSAVYHEVAAGETLYSISRLYEMKVDQLVEMNNLKEPYSVHVGQKIRISKNIAIAAQAAPKPIENKSENAAEKPNFVERTLDKLNHFSWPVRGKVVSKFGPKSGGLYNDGIKIKVAEGTEVKAAEDGVVAYVGNELKGYGNLVIIKHGNGWISAYAHLKNWNVKRGEKIEKGQKIGAVGATGNVDSPQLYFGLRKGRDAVNPENYLK